MLLRKTALILACLAILGLQACATSSGFNPMPMSSASGSTYDSDNNTGGGGY